MANFFQFCDECKKEEHIAIAHYIVPKRKSAYNDCPGEIKVCEKHLKTKNEFQIRSAKEIHRDSDLDRIISELGITAVPRKR